MTCHCHYRLNSVCRMPTLKQLTCNVECEDSTIPLQEYQIAYSDGYVTTYIAVPDEPAPFSIHLRSDGYIAPGLAMFVYVDGLYQCNRNRQNLKVANEATDKSQTETDFRVRQKEQMLWDGTFTGRPWLFTRVNVGTSSRNRSNPLGTDVSPTGSDSSINPDERAPHDGAYVGTIEVVVLRCYAFDGITRSISTATTLVNPESSSSAEDEGPDRATLPAAATADKQADPNSRNGPKSKTNGKAKTKIKRRMFGLDGSWDVSGPFKSPSREQKKVQQDPWDNWTMPPTAAEEPSNKSWGDPLPTIDEPKTGNVELMSASEGIYHPVTGTKKAGSQVGSQASARRNSLQGSTQAELQTGLQSGSHRRASQAGSENGNRKDSLHNMSQQIPGATGQPDSTAVHLRGGGSGSQSIRSRHTTGRDSPLVVNNSIVYNGVGSPPPLSSGPPPARDFWANMEANQLAKSAPKAISKPARKANGWGGGKVDSWNAGGSEMPGAWETSNQVQKNEDTWGGSNNQAQADNDAWGGDVQDGSAEEGTHNGDTFDNDGKDFGWGQQKDDAIKKGDNWNNPGDQVNADGNSCGGFDEDNEQDDNWANNDTSHGAHGVAWDSGNASNSQQNDAWTANTAEPAPTAVAVAPRNSVKGSKSQIPKATSANGSKAGSISKPSSIKPPATSNKPKPKSSLWGWFNSSSKKTPETVGNANQASGPNTWGLPSNESKKKASPMPVAAAGEEAQDQHSFSILTPPEAKPYWSNWKDPNTLKDPTANDERAAPTEGPLYKIPRDLAERNQTSHQVRPGVPAKYSHKVSKPKYMDSHEHPYAVFVFQYRDKDTIEQMLNTPVVEPEVDEKQRLSRLPKAQLVDELIRMKSQSSSKGASGSRHSSGKVTFKSNPYGVPMNPNASALTQKLSKLEGSKAPTPEKVGGWLENANGKGKDHSNGENTQGESTSDETNDSGKNGGGNTWGTHEPTKDGKVEADPWDNNNTYAADDTKDDANDTAWNNNNNYTSGGDTWDNTNYNATSETQDHTNEGDGWGNSGDDNNTSNHDGGDTAGGSWDDNNNATNDKKDDNSWGVSGFGGLDTSW